MDSTLLQLLNGTVAWPLVRQLVWLIHQPWSPILLILALIAFAWRQRRWWDLLAVAAAIAVSDPLCARLLKPLFARPRPCLDPDIMAPFGCGSGWSMPSCHAANAFALAAAVGAPWAWVLATIVALSRVVAGVHHPSDVAVGAAAGTLVGLSARALLRWSLKRWRAGREEAPSP